MGMPPGEETPGGTPPGTDVLSEHQFMVTVMISDDDIARAEEPYYVRLDVEGKLYDVTDIRLIK